jgi:hypothetical protein
MTALRPRQTSHRGSVMAAGLAIDTRIAGEAAARARILRLTLPGLAVFRSGPVLLVRFPDPIRLDAAAAGGAPLVRYGRLLSAAPLAADEQDRLDAALGAFEDTAVLVEGGQAGAVPLDGGASVDVSEWIDVSGFSVASGLQPLGKVQPGPQAAIAAAGTVRQSFGLAPLDREAAETLQALMGRTPHGGTQGESLIRRMLAMMQQFARRRRTAAPAASNKLAHRAAPAAPARGLPRPGWWAALRRLFVRAPQSAKIAPASSRPGGIATPAAPPQSLIAALRDRFARAVWSSQLARLLGRRYAAHLARVLAMLDAQDYDNALRNAVPLSDEVASALRPPPLGLPAARADLAIRTGPRVAGTALNLGSEVFELLRQRYRRAFERLDTMGDVEKAAFVLAELLNAAEEAVSYLERHRRFKLAAELAEARGLPPGLVIRLWFLAGDRARAVQIARLTGAFADAVLRLEQSHKEEARILRLMWADALASAGAFAAAVDAAWAVVEARHVVDAWIDRAIAVGGPAGARMLARKIARAPEQFAGLRDRALDLLQRESEEGTADIMAFAQELADHEPTAETRVLARPAVRRLLREGRNADVERLSDRLLKNVDQVFAADVRAATPAVPAPRVPLRARPEPLEISLPAGRSGIPSTDAAMLPDGRMLVAAGELGVFLLSREGKVIMRFAEPADALVVSDQGDRAIVLARRGEVFRVSRLDLTAKRLQHWCDARFTRFASDFDGSIWFVAHRSTLYAIDTLAPRWTHLWKVDEQGATVHDIARDGRWMSALFVGQRREVWTWELPSITLRRRQPVEWDGEVAINRFTAVSPSGLLVAWTIDPAQDLADDPLSCRDYGAAIMNIDGTWKKLPVRAPSSAQDAAATNDWIALPVLFGSQPLRSVIHLVETSSPATRLRLTLDGAEPASVRIQAGHLIVSGVDGRVVAVSLLSGAILRDIRLAP